MTLLAFAIAVVVIALALSAIMALAWVIQQRTWNSGWVDAVWTFGLGAVGIVSALASVGPLDGSWRGWIIAAFLTAWALRLGTHISHRTAGSSDDPRYAELIKGWGASARSEMFWLLQKQALVSIPLATAAMVAAHNPNSELRSADVFAIVLMLVALTGEAVADRQLRRFRAKPANRALVCDVGLWRYSRHPNYFFEWLGWAALPFLAIDLSGEYPWGWVALAAPACMYWLLVHVSGIPPLEQHMLRSRGEAYVAYQRRTSPFFLLPLYHDGRAT